MVFYSYSEIFEHWLNHQNDIRKHLNYIVKDKSVIDDILHETLLKIIKTCCSGTEINNIRAWFKRCAHNVAIDHIKDVNRFSFEEVEVQSATLFNLYKNAEPIIMPLCKLIPNKYAEPLIMADLQNERQNTIAQHLDISLVATKSRILRGRQKLKDLVVECCHIDKEDNGQLFAITPKCCCNALRSVTDEIILI
ncbi:MAG: hypothetical protein N4A72_09310 [Bacteroidales bacterium]|jgi:RNA polymerase sigma-70 factor (ECF subfamily)|nr:hypothetical protein [Bacteroidales bacterium]